MSKEAYAHKAIEEPFRRMMLLFLVHILELSEGNAEKIVSDCLPAKADYSYVKDLEGVDLMGAAVDAGFTINRILAKRAAHAMRLVTPYTPYCDEPGCGKLPFRQQGTRWVLVSDGLCPHCEEELVVPKGAIGESVCWWNGEMVPDNTYEIEGLRVAPPLSTVHSSIQAAIQEVEGATLPRFLGFMWRSVDQAPKVRQACSHQPEQLLVHAADPSGTHIFGRRGLVQLKMLVKASVGPWKEYALGAPYRTSVSSSAPSYQSYLSILEDFLPGQFETLRYRLGIPRAHLAGSQAQRAVAVLEFLKGNNVDITELNNVLRACEYRGELPS